MSTNCKQLKHNLEELVILRTVFELEYKKARETGDEQKARKLKKELEQKYQALEKNYWPFHDLTLKEVEEPGGVQIESISFKEIKRQYETQRAILEKVGIIKRLATGEMGIVEKDTVNDQEYKFPSFSEVLSEMIKQKEKLKTKMAQGFTQLQFTPFGMKLEVLAEIAKKVILEHHRQKKLFIPKEDPTASDELFDLNIRDPMQIVDAWIDPHLPKWQRGSDYMGECVYNFFPRGQEHETVKTDILAFQENSPLRGWQVQFIEPNLIIAREGCGKVIGGRKQFETNQTADQYDRMLFSDPEYAFERGESIEDWFTMLINNLETNNQVIDYIYENGDRGSGCLLLGSYNRDTHQVGIGWCHHEDKCAKVTGIDKMFDDPVIGARTVVPL